MSRNNTAHCKVCQDAGKPETVYRSHFTRETRDPNSRVICPTLLALECRFCFKKGHTVKYCSTLKEKDRQKQSSKFTSQKSKPASQKSAEKPKSSNPYVCLDSDSEEEDQKVSIKTNESFPQLCVPAKIQHQGIHDKGLQYALALGARPLPKADLNPVPVANSAPKLAPWVSAVDSSTVSLPLPPRPIRRPMRNWADDTDSEDEEDLAPINVSKDYKYNVSVIYEEW